VVGAMTKRLQLGADFEFLDGKYSAGSELTNPNIPIIPPSQGIRYSVSGNTMVQSPKFTSSIFGQYALPVGEAGELKFYGTWFRQSGRYFTAFEDPQLFAPTYNVLSAKITYTPKAKHWHAAIYGQNLSNTLIISDIQTDTPSPGRGVYYGSPRTFGIEGGFKY
jgi:iron complex outermembrane recepter protein